MSYQKNEVTDVTVPVATEPVVATIVVPVSRGVLVLEIKNTGSYAFDTFQLEIQAVVDGAWIVTNTASADFTTPLTPLVWARDDPYTLAAGASSLLKINVDGLAGVRVSASANATATTVSVWSNFAGALER